MLDLERAKAEVARLSEPYRLGLLVMDAGYVPPAVNPRLVGKLLGMRADEDDNYGMQASVPATPAAPPAAGAAEAFLSWALQKGAPPDGGYGASPSSFPPAANAAYSYESGDKMKMLELERGRVAAAAAAAGAAVSPVPRLPLDEVARDRMNKYEAVAAAEAAAAAAAREAGAAVAAAEEAAAVAGTPGTKASAAATAEAATAADTADAAHTAAVAAADAAAAHAFDERFGFGRRNNSSDEAIDREAAMLAFAAKLTEDKRASMASENVDAKITALKVGLYKLNAVIPDPFGIAWLQHLEPIL